MEKTIESIVNKLNYNDLQLIRQACESVKQNVDSMLILQNLCEQALKTRKFDDITLNKEILLSNIDSVDINSFLYSLKESSFEELKFIEDFFDFIYKVTSDNICSAISSYTGFIIYIKEHIELIANNKIDPYTLEDFAFWTHGINNVEEKNLNKFFGVDVKQLQKGVLRKIK